MSTSVSSQSKLDVSLKAYFSEAIRPRTLYGRIFLVLVVLRASSYWILSAWQHPHEPLSLLAMYRIGDIEYYPPIFALSRLNLGEFSVFENFRQGLQVFPLASILPYSLAIFCFGLPGFIIADICIVLCHYIVLVVMFKILRIPTFLSSCASLLVVTQGINPVFYLFTKFYSRTPSSLFTGIFCINLAFLVLLITIRYMKKEIRFPSVYLHIQVTSLTLLQFFTLGIIVFSIWYWRIPRPFVTDIYFFLCLCLMATLLNYAQFYIEKKKYWRIWFFLGLCTSALLQGEIFLSLTILFSVVSIMAYLLIDTSVNQEDYWKYHVKGYVIFFIATTISSLPWGLQQLFSHPDIAKRLGMFPVKRMRLFFLPGWKSIFVIVSALIISWCVIVFFQQWAKKEKYQSIRKNIVALCLLCVISWGSLPLSVMILGKTIQPAHFPYRLENIFSLIIFVFLLYITCHYIDINQKIGKIYLTRRLLICIVIFLSLYASIRFSYPFSQNTGRPVATGEADFLSIDTYRADFFDLIHELSRQKEKGAKIIGTFDFQVYTYWVGFQNGYSFLPYAAFSPLADRDIEKRLASFCNLLGSDTENFVALINQNYILYFWLSTLKYQASKAYTFSTLSDYEPQVQKSIITSGILDNYTLALPISEQKRLIKIFETLEITEEYVLPDLIVLTNGMVLKQLTPRHDIFEKIYENPTFRVWIRKGTI